MAVQVKVRFLSSVPPPVPLMLVKVAMLVLVMFERITALGRVSIWVCPLPAKPALPCHSAGESEVVSTRPHREGDREEGRSHRIRCHYVY